MADGVVYYGMLWCMLLSLKYVVFVIISVRFDSYYKMIRCNRRTSKVSISHFSLEDSVPLSKQLGGVCLSKGVYQDDTDVGSLSCLSDYTTLIMATTGGNGLDNGVRLD